MNMVFRGIFVAVMLMLAASSRASLVVFAFTNSSTGMLDTNVYRLTPRSNVQNADGTWNTKGPTVQYQNPTGYATNWLVPNNYLVTNPATGFWESIRVNDNSSNLVWAGNISLGQNANPFVNLVYNPSIAPGANITFATNGNVITIASTGGGNGATTNGIYTIAKTNAANAVAFNLDVPSLITQQQIATNGSSPTFNAITLTNQAITLTVPNPFSVTDPRGTVLNIWTNYDVFFGLQAGENDFPPAATTYQLNVGIGNYALSGNVTGLGNTAVGASALNDSGEGMNNTAIGAGALYQSGKNATPPNIGGTNNIALGYLAGSAFVNNESSNIDIGNIGVAAENNIIRIGTSQSQTYIAGQINGNGAGLTGLPAGQLTGTVPLTALGNALTNTQPGVSLGSGFNVGMLYITNYLSLGISPTYSILDYLGDGYTVISNGQASISSHTGATMVLSANGDINLSSSATAGSGVVLALHTNGTVQITGQLTGLNITTNATGPTGALNWVADTNSGVTCLSSNAVGTNLALVVYGTSTFNGSSLWNGSPNFTFSATFNGSGGIYFGPSTQIKNIAAVGLSINTNILASSLQTTNGVVDLGPGFTGNGSNLTNIPSSGISAIATNMLTLMSLLDFKNGQVNNYGFVATNANFTFTGPTNVNFAAVNQLVVDVTNTAGGTINITLPAGIRGQGTFNCTNRTLVSFYCAWGLTNAIAYPIQ